MSLLIADKNTMTRNDGNSMAVESEAGADENDLYKVDENNQPKYLSTPSLMQQQDLESRRKKKKKKRRGYGAENIEQIFASVSKILASGLNPPPEKIMLTPRSAESCLKCGVSPETLRIRDLDSFREGDISPAVQRMRHEAYSQRRHEQMKVLRIERKRIMGNDESNHTTKSKQKNSPLKISQQQNQTSSSSLVDLEKRRLEKIQFRQQREIQQMLEFEMKMNRLQEEANQKVELEQKRQMQLETEKKKRAREIAELKRQKELQKKAEADAEEQRRLQLSNEMFYRDKVLANQRKKQERLRKLEAKKEEQKRREKALKHRQHTKEILKRQEEEVIRRLEQLDNAEEERTKLLQEQREIKAKQMEQRRCLVSKRISKNIKKASKLEAKRKKEIRKKQEHNEALREQLILQQEHEREIARQEQELMERKRQYVLEETKRADELRKQELINRQKEIEQNVAKTQEAHHRHLQLKKEQKLINKQLKMDKVERMRRIQEYKRLETLRKLKESEERTERMLQEKEDLLRQRKEASVRNKIQRDTIVRTMENVKVTKKWTSASKTIEKVIKSPKKSPSKRVKSSEGMKRNSSLPTLPKSSRAAEQGHIVKQDSPPRRSEFKFAKSAVNKLEEPTAYVSPYDIVPADLEERKNMKQSKHIRSSVF